MFLEIADESEVDLLDLNGKSLMRYVITITILSLLFLGSVCEEPTEPKAADCDQGYHPCVHDITICCRDTTSHIIYNWGIDSLGSTGIWSFLHDVAIIDNSSVWVVGDIRIWEDDGTQTHYNAAHWDGEEWELYGFVGGAGSGSVFTIYGLGRQ